VEKGVVKIPTIYGPSGTKDMLLRGASFLGYGKVNRDLSIFEFP
jgi:hypothetical protein